MRDLMVEMGSEMERIEDYKKRIEEAYVCGLTKRAKKIIMAEDQEVQGRIKEAKESIKMIEREVDNGK